MPSPTPVNIPPHVLLIEDDDPAVPGFLTKILAGAGYRVTTGRPADAPAAVDLVVLDAGPSASDLRGVLTEVRRRWPKVPVLVLLASADAGVWLAIAADGRSGALEKPFLPTAFVRSVREMLAGPQPVR